ncbi:TetR/AcrR family transcriptional regulator [Geodermatophilus marinus]|uniref:TetR/AcrR family transcriptional regulator n=1 Tax=Geodermatophilus sp. LHW52908 TaxID=2303986 RepID=UPI000E3E7C69|nr:TetR family transcriptional regulator [Geodermatophilus sp. LHW52908]RFU21073.1 TetR family transcriptional regulator [Geodermatophilus sp. LHW52908]
MSEPREPRTPRWERTHRRIYEVAMGLFAEHGFEAVTVAAIAAAARVTVPTFYDHFSSKENIVLPLPETSDVEAVMALQPPGLPLGERLRRGIRGWLGAVQGRDREELLDRWRIVIRTPGLRSRAAEFERRTVDIVLAALGAERDATAAVVTAAMFSAYTQILLRWAESDGDVPLEDLIEEVLRALREL